MMRRFTTFDAEAVDWAAFAANAPHFGGRKNRSSPAQKAGLRYERKAQVYLEEMYPNNYVASPWIVFRLRHEPMVRWCQPDGLVVDPQESKLTIIEIKLRHMAEAYTQMTGIYDPVIRKIFPPNWRIRHCEVVRYYDPDSLFPVPVQLVTDPLMTPAGRFAVHIWR
jgi:hypothetical protein